MPKKDLSSHLAAFEGGARKARKTRRRPRRSSRSRSRSRSRSSSTGYSSSSSSESFDLADLLKGHAAHRRPGSAVLGDRIKNSSFLPGLSKGLLDINPALALSLGSTPLARSITSSSLSSIFSDPTMGVFSRPYGNKDYVDAATDIGKRGIDKAFSPPVAASIPMMPGPMPGPGSMTSGPGSMPEPYGPLHMPVHSTSTMADRPDIPHRPGSATFGGNQ